MNAESEEERPDDELDNQIGKMSVTSDWWRPHLSPDDLESILPSSKLRAMFEILKQCAENGEKCLIFSAFVAVLDVVEFFMQKIHRKDENCRLHGLERFRGPWHLGQDFYRLDGKTGKQVRHLMITKFNDPSNTRTKCFLISAKAGGQGINLIGANRVIILDTSWNPSNDQQNIFRIFRLGQTRPCFVYRLLAMGTMEEKVYSRSVTKQAMSFRVVDEQQIERHYNMADLAELYTLTKTDLSQRPTPIRPADNILSSLLHNFQDLVYKYHEHDSLLENKPEQDLSEQDKAEAWAAYEKDVTVTRNTAAMFDNPFGDPNFMHSPNSSIRTGQSGGLNYQYGYTKPYGGNFGMQNYANALASGGLGLPGFNYPFQQSLATDPNILRMRQMYQNPYGNLNSPTGQSGNMGDTSPYGGGGASNFYGGGLVNPSSYFKSITPPGSAQIRPMTGSFNSLNDMANFLASSNTPPPQSPGLLSMPLASPSSSVSSNVSASNYLAKEQESNMWKNYFSNPNALNLFSPGATGQLSTVEKMMLSNMSAAASIGQPSTANASGSGTNYAALAKDLSKHIMNQNIMKTPAAATLASNSAVNDGHRSSSIPSVTANTPVTQPSIPTSVITKPSRPPSAISMSSNKSAPLSTTNSTSDLGRYSPQPHVISKTSKTVTPSTSSTITTVPKSTPVSAKQQSSAAAAAMVKNYNMGIVYPGSKDTAINPNSGQRLTPSSLAALQLQNNVPNKLPPPNYNKNNLPQLNKSVNSTITAHTIDKSKPSILKRANTTIGSSNNKTNILSLSNTTITKQGGVNNNLPQSLNKLTKSHSNLSLKSTSQLKSNTPINISELSKASGLSITPVPSSSSNLGNRSMVTSGNNNQSNPNYQQVKTYKTTPGGTPVKPIAVAKPQQLSTPVRINKQGRPVSTNQQATTITPTNAIKRTVGNTSIIQTSSVGGGSTPNLVQIQQNKIQPKRINMINTSVSNSTGQSGMSTVRYSNAPQKNAIQSSPSIGGSTTTLPSSYSVQSKPMVAGSSPGNKSVPPLVLARSQNAQLKSIPSHLQQISGTPKKLTSINALPSSSSAKPPVVLSNAQARRQTEIKTNALKRKSVALNNLAANSSLTVTELKHKNQMTGQSVDNTIKKLKTFDGVTIVPRNVQATQNLRNTKKDNNIVDIVELD